MTALDFPTSPSNGDTYENYIYDGTKAVWRINPQTPGFNLESLSDTAITTPTDGQALVYDTATSKWVNETSTIAGLDDTDITTPVTGDSLVYDGTDWVNGPRSHNAIINGDFGVWQRGTSIGDGSTALNIVYLADRWRNDDGVGGNSIISREAFPIGQTDVPDNPAYFHRVDFPTTAGTGNQNLQQRIEDVSLFSGQNATLSFWVKGTMSGSFTPTISQNFGSGGSTEVKTNGATFTVSGTWTKIVRTFSVPSVSGKTVGDGNYVAVIINFPDSELGQIDVANVQFEAGSVATPFRLAGGGSKAAELALCQRYFIDQSTGSVTGRMFVWCFSSTSARGVMYLPVEMRTTPAVTLPSGLTNLLRNTASGLVTPSGVNLANNPTGGAITLNFTVSGVSTNEIFAAVFTEALFDAEL